MSIINYFRNSKSFKAIYFFNLKWKVDIFSIKHFFSDSLRSLTLFQLSVGYVFQMIFLRSPLIFFGTSVVQLRFFVICLLKARIFFFDLMKLVY